MKVIVAQSFEQFQAYCKENKVKEKDAVYLNPRKPKYWKRINGLVNPEIILLTVPSSDLLKKLDATKLVREEEEAMGMGAFL